MLTYKRQPESLEHALPPLSQMDSHVPGSITTEEADSWGGYMMRFHRRDRVGTKMHIWCSLQSGLTVYFVLEHLFINLRLNYDRLPASRSGPTKFHSITVYPHVEGLAIH